MKLRAQATSIVLIALAIAAALYAYVIDRGSVTETEKEARVGRVFSAFRRPEVTRIVIAHGPETIALEKSGDAWRMRAPHDEPADFAAVERLVGDLEAASRVREVKDGAASLDPPRARVTVTMGALTATLALGSSAPSPEGSAYARLETGGDARVFVVRRELADALMKGADSYRDRTIAPYGLLEIARIELGGARASGAIERVNPIDFKVVGGGRAPRAVVEKIGAAIGDLRADAFLDDAAAEAAMRDPAITLVARARDADKPALTLVVGGACPSLASDVVVVRTSPSPRLAACAPKLIADALAVRASSLADTRVFSSRDDEIVEIRLEGEGRVVDVARVGGGWHERASQSRALVADQIESVGALAIALAHLDGVPADVPFDRAAIKATLVRAEAAGDEMVEVGRPDDDGRVIVRRAIDGALLRLEPDAARKLAPRETTLRGRDVWSPSARGLAIRRVATTCAGVPQELVHDGDRWTMRPPPEKPGKARETLDVARALDLANAVLRLRADAWVADRDDGRFGLTRGACALEVDVTGEDGAARALVVTLGAAGEGGTYAQVGGDPAVLVAPASLKLEAARPLVLAADGGVGDAGVESPERPTN